MSEQIVLPEINLEQIKKIKKQSKEFPCPQCGKVYKSKRAMNNHLNKCEVEGDNDEDFDITQFENMTEEELMKYMQEQQEQQEHQEHPHNMDDDKELTKLRKELEQIVLANPSLDLDKPYSNTTLEKIQTMNATELRARIFQAKRELTCQLDCKISDGALSFANQVIGRMLGCVDELHAQVMNDTILRESTKDLLSMQLLSKIPPNLKVSGLYAVNVGVALQKAKANKISQ
jgi:hypothetical protein